MAYGKSDREEAAYLAGRADAQVLCNMYFAGTNKRPPDLMKGREQTARDIALWIERHGLEHDRMVPILGDCIAVYRAGNITCIQPILKDTPNDQD